MINKKNRPSALIADPNDPRHGTRAGYDAHRRAGVWPACDPCKRGAAGYQAGLKHDHDRGVSRGPVPNVGVRRRLQALHALGWSCFQIGEQLGVSGRVARDYRVSETSTPETFERVKAVYDRMSMRVPDESTRTGRQVAAHVRTIARKNGWVPPLAWDNIDYDEAPPQVDDGGLSAKERRDAERLDRLEVMDTEHRTVTYAAEALGLSREGLNAWCRDRGHMDLYWRLFNRDPEAGGNHLTPAA